MRDRICEHLAGIFGVDAADILSKSRRIPLPYCRMILSYALCKKGFTRSAVGAAVRMDHSSVTTCYYKMEGSLSSPAWKDIQQAWRRLCDELDLDNEAAARFRSSLQKDSAPAGEILLNTFAIITIKQQKQQWQTKSK